MTKETIVAKTMTVNDVPAMLEQVKEQIKALTGDTKNKEVTVPFPGFGLLSDINDISILIKAASVVRAKEREYVETAPIVMPKPVEGAKAIPVPTFKLEGITAKVWLNAITVRIGEVYNADKLSKLKAVKSKLEANLSAEMKLANSLKEIAELIKD